MNSRWRRRVWTWRVVIVVVMVLSLVDAPVARAAGPGLFFSEYVEGTGNNQALEIYNGTGAAVDLAAGRYVVEFYLNGAGSPGHSIALTGRILPGGVYVLANDAAAAALRQRADQLEGGTWFDGNDAVVLRRGPARLDVIGQIGFDPGTGWGSFRGHTTVDTTLRRAETFCQGDANGTDGFDPIGRWNGAPVDALEELGLHVARCPTLPVPLWVVWVGLAAVCLGAVYVLERKQIKLGIISTFLKWLAGIVLLGPVAEFVVARSDARTIVLAAMGELGLIGLIAGILVGRKEGEAWVGALQWLGVILLSYVWVGISYSDAGARLHLLPEYSEWAAVAVSLIAYQAAFWTMRWLARSPGRRTR